MARLYNGPCPMGWDLNQPSGMGRTVCNPIARGRVVDGGYMTDARGRKLRLPTLVGSKDGQESGCGSRT